MKLSYYPETDSLYISLSDRPGTDVVPISDEVVVDVDENGRPVGIDISAGASEVADLRDLALERAEDGDRASLKLKTSFLVESVEITKARSVG